MIRGIITMAYEASPEVDPTDGEEKAAAAGAVDWEPFDLLLAFVTLMVDCNRPTISRSVETHCSWNWA